MDPNNNQPIGSSPVQQPAMAPQPVPPTPPTEAAPVAPQNASQSPKKGMGKRIILLVILALLVVGIATYILFMKNQLNNTQKTNNENSSSVLPSPTTIPTLTPEADLEIGSPEGDLMELDADVKGL